MSSTLPTKDADQLPIGVTMDRPLSVTEDAPSAWRLSTEGARGEVINGDRPATASAHAMGVATVSPSGALLPDESYAGVHDVLKRVDVWFEIEAAKIERTAADFAEKWAVANLPTPGALPDGVIEPEQVLARRAGELWQQWGNRVRVKLQDAIDSAADDVAQSVSKTRNALTEYRIARDELRHAEARIESIRKLESTERGPVRYERLFPKWLTLLLGVALVLVEFVANQPVFRIIWPMPSNVTEALAGIIDEASTGQLAGLKVTSLEMLSYVEASLLALVVVILLFVLAKQFGASVRPLAALRDHDYPYAARSIRALHRQQKVISFVTAFGCACILFFLYSARAQAPAIAEERYAKALEMEQQAQVRVDSVAVGADFAAVEVANNRLADASAERAHLEEAQAFARTIAVNSLGIFVLNLSLVCFGFVVGFMSDSRDLSETVGEHPDLPKLREKCAGLRASLQRLEDRAQEAVRSGELAAARVKSLLRSRPVDSLEAKRERLESVIPQWRTENARLRRLDPSIIGAFQRTVPLQLNSLDGTVAPNEPEIYASSVAALAEVSREVDQLTLRADVSTMEAAA